MGRLTFHEHDGKFGVAGMDARNELDKIYACICKLKDYEDIGLSPDEVEQLKYKYEDLLERYNKSNRVDCSAAEKIGELCSGYQRGLDDDEPCEQCKECEKNTFYAESH